MTNPDDKVCKDCGQTKSVDNFVRDKRRPDGRENRCKECANERRREWLRSKEQESKPTPESTMRSQAAQRALKKLVQRHRTEFMRILQDEQFRVGIEKRKWHTLVDDAL